MIESAIYEISEMLAEAERREKELRAELDEISADVAAHQRTLERLQERHDEGDGEAKATKLAAADLSGLSIFGAAVVYAQRHDNVLNSYYARPLLTEAGILPDDREAASSALYQTLSSSECFERLPEKGRWKLVREVLVDGKPIADL